MKRRTDVPSEHKMLYFTPELYRRFNSEDEAIALAADAEWEAAIARYHQYLTKLQEKAPSRVIELSKLCLHDGEILQRQEDRADPPRHWPVSDELATLAVRLDDELVTLFYLLRDRITEQSAAEDWPFSREREHWLYDEVHLQRGDRDGFTHQILLSSGVVLTIPFVTVLISRFRLSPVSVENGKQSA
jgi:hypothetical protein